MSFFQSNVLRDAGAHHRERRYQHPEPPRLANRSRQRDCDDEKTDSHEDVFESTLQRYFFAMPAAATTFHEILWRRLRQLARQSLRNEADVCSARATKTRAVEMLCCALRTEHSFLAFHPLASRFVKQYARSH